MYMRFITHRNLAKMCWPHIPFRIIDEVNRSIDNPDKKMLALQKSGVIDPKALDVFKLNKSAGHRKYNHSIPSAFMSAYQISPKYAADLAIVHLLADRMSNYMHDTMGTESRDVAEALINKNYMLFRETSNFKKSRRRKMYYE